MPAASRFDFMDKTLALFYELLLDIRANIGVMRELFIEDLAARSGISLDDLRKQYLEDVEAEAKALKAADLKRAADLQATPQSSGEPN